MLGGMVGKIERTAVVIIAILTLLVFYPVYSHDFVTWDDTHNVAANQDMLAPSWAKVKGYWTRPFKDLYIPVTYTLWAGVANVAQISGVNGVQLNPAVFHAVNSFLHVASAIVVFAILRRLIGNVWAALLGALVFAVHPVQVEPVAWVSGMKDVLSGLLALIAVLTYILFAQTNKLWWHALATAMFVLAMLAKPSAVVVPFVVLIIEWLVLKRGLRDAIVGPALWFLLALPVVIVGMLAQPPQSSMFVPPLWARPVVALDALAFYLMKLLAPLHLAIDYGRSPQWLWSSWQIWVTWLIPVFVALVALWIAWRMKFVLIAAGLAVMAVALLPVLGFVPFDFQSYSTTADHYLYFAMLGPALLVAAVVHRWMKRAVIGAVVVWILFLALQSNLQSWVWHDSQSLFQHTVDTNPKSLAGLVNLGKYYADQGPQLARQGLYQAAEDSLRRAIGLYEKAAQYYPKDAQAREGLANTHGILGWVILMEGKIDSAIAEFETALKIDPENAEAAKLLAQTKALREKKTLEKGVR